MKIINTKQGSDEWFEIRCGRITGSRAKEVFKSDNSSFIDLLISEKLTDTIESSFTSGAMQWGLDNEEPARNRYSDETGNQVHEVGICLNDKLDFLGLSPDGLVYKDENAKENEPIGAVEIKCPSSKVHVKYIRNGGIPKEYIYQIQMYFIVCETIEWLDFVSYDPRVTLKPLNVVRITRKELFNDLVNTEYELKQFNEQLTKEYEKIIF